jgi:ketosteroid isomerase-like protein
MHRRTLLTSAAALLAGASHATAQTLAGGPVADQVEAAERAFAASMAKRDVRAFAALVAPDAVFVAGGATPRPLRGKAAVLEWWNQFFAAPAAPFSWEPDLVQVLESGGLALTSGPVKDPTGKITGRFNSIWRREADGQWKIVFDKGQPVCN